MGGYDTEVTRTRNGLVAAMIVPHDRSGRVVEDGVRLFAFTSDEAARFGRDLWCAACGDGDDEPAPE